MLCDTNVVNFKLLKDRSTKTNFPYKKGPFELYVCIRIHNSHSVTSTESRMTPTISQCFQFLGLIIMKSKEL